MLEHFVDDDGGYLAWLQADPSGFVINGYRNPRPGYLLLHRSDCQRINGTPANGRSWTKSYRKVCGKRSELETWARQDVGGEPQECDACFRVTPGPTPIARQKKHLPTGTDPQPAPPQRQGSCWLVLKRSDVNSLRQLSSRRSKQRPDAGLTQRLKGARFEGSKPRRATPKNAIRVRAEASQLDAILGDKVEQRHVAAKILLVSCE